MSTENTTATQLSAADRDFHRREALRLRALAKTITTKTIRAKVLQQAEEHAQLVGLPADDGAA